jgi:hypothetical protein
MTATLLMTLILAGGATAQESVTLNVPGTPANAPTTLTGCLMPGGGTTSTPGSGGASGTGPAGMNADAANTGVFFVIDLGRKRRKTTESSYSLVGVDPEMLRRYANSRVEVHGVIQPPAPPAGRGKNVSVATGKRSTSKSASQFRVTAIKQIPGSCGGQ